MSRSNWRAILAIVGLILFGTGSTVTYQLYNASEQRQADYSYQPANHASFKNAMARQPVAKGYQPYCNNPDNKENADLCAQWAAVQQVAEANRMSSLNLRFAIVSLWATIIGTVLLLWTLVETRETARRELRAYLFVDAIDMGDGTHLTPDPLQGRVAIFLVVKNSGSTPAHQVTHWSEVTIGPISDQSKMSAPSSLEPNNLTTIPPSGTITANRQMKRKPSARTIQSIKAGKSAVYAYGAIEYSDVFERRHRTDYRLMYTGHWPPPQNPTLSYCIDGNHAT